MRKRNIGSKSEYYLRRFSRKLKWTIFFAAVAYGTFALVVSNPRFAWSQPAKDGLGAFKQLAAIVLISSVTSLIGKFVFENIDYRLIIDQMEVYFNINSRSIEQGISFVHAEFDPSVVTSWISRGDIVRIFVTWQSKFEVPHDNVERWLNAGADVEIIMFSPLSPLVALREKQIEHDKGTGSPRIRQIHKEFTKLQRKCLPPSRFQWRFTYFPIPCPAYMLIREKSAIRALTGFYLTSSDEAGTFIEWGLSSDDTSSKIVLHELGQFFKNMWESSNVDPEKPMLTH